MSTESMHAIDELERISIELAYAVADCRAAGKRPPILRKLDDIEDLLPQIRVATLAIRIELDEKRPPSK
jgi:hypothetical protein